MNKKCHKNVDHLESLHDLKPYILILNIYYNEWARYI